MHPLACSAAGDVPMQGYGLVLVCGLKADGGALRTFVIHVINGSVADKASLLEGRSTQCFVL